MNGHKNPMVGRRPFLLGLTSAGASLGLAPMAGSVLAREPAADHRFVGFFFNGAWDILLGPDARDPSLTYEGIDLGTELLEPRFREPIEVNVGGTPVLWGSPMAAVARHSDLLTLFQGINMNTVAHPTGRAYVNTFEPPTGVVANGDSFGVRMSSLVSPDDFIVPNVSIGVPCFNREHPRELTAMGVSTAPDIQSILSPLYEPLNAETRVLIRAAQESSGSCVDSAYPARPADELALSRQQVRRLLQGNYSHAFDLAADSDLVGRYGITDPTDPREAAVVAATAWKLFETGLSSSVTLRLPARFDTHGANWASDQPVLLEEGFTALAALLDDLRRTDPDLRHTTVMAYSEFARTPTINGRGGRDHWFANSILVFGGGLRRGVFGATLEQTLGLQNVDLITGRPSPTGEVIRPEHVGATVAAAAGLDISSFRVDPLDAWIEPGE